MLQFRLIDSLLLLWRIYKIKFNKKEKKCNENSQIGGGQNRLKADSHFTNSHTFPKIAIGLALLFGGANIAFAEESGGFVGIGIGGGGTELKIDMKAYDGLTDKSTTNLGGINYSFVAGYKQFFTPYLGLRYYVNLDLHHNLKKVDDVEQTFRNDVLVDETYLGKTRYDITLINYGINVDFLGNFLVTEMVDFGGFIGLGIGANSVTGKFIKDMKDGFVGSGVKFSDTGFDIALNLGLRTNIAKYHGLEFSARVPFMPIKMVDYADEIGFKVKQTFGQQYNILARYTFSF